MKKIILYCLILLTFISFDPIISLGQVVDEIYNNRYKKNMKLDPPDTYFGWTCSETYVRNIVYNNDGTILASIADTGQSLPTITDPLIKLWDPNTGLLIKTLSGHKYIIDKIAFSNDGKLLAANSIDLSIKLWDVNSGKILKNLILGGGNNFNPFSFTPDGKTLAYSFFNQLNFYDINGDSTLKTIQFAAHFWIDDITFSPDGKKMAVVGFFTNGADCIMEIFDVEKWISIWKWTIQSLGTFSSVEFSPNGIIAACSGPTPNVYLFDSNTGTMLNNISIDPGNSSLFYFSPDSKLIALKKSKGRGGIQLYDVNNFVLIRSIVFDVNYPLSIAFSPDGKKIAAGSIGDKNIRIYDLSSTNDVKTIESPKEFCLSQNYPNPFNPSTVINYQLPVNSFVTLKIYNILGKEMVTLVNEKQTVGTHSIMWEAKNIPAGVYFYRLRTEKYSEVKKMVLIK